MAQDRTYHAVFDDGAKHELTAAQLADLSTDMASWLAFIGMTLGGPSALMTAHHENGSKTHLRVSTEPLDGYAPP